jgi:hypothetical protein
VDFLSCRDSWQALVQYMLALFAAWEEEHIADFTVLRDDPDELHVHLTHCAFASAFQEAGYPEIGYTGDQVEVEVFCHKATQMGGEFRRESCLCQGDATCDWHFFRHKLTE